MGNKVIFVFLKKLPWTEHKLLKIHFISAIEVLNGYANIIKNLRCLLIVSSHKQNQNQLRVGG